MGSSKIEWTGATWNPVTGCTKVSPGCAHCYAEWMAKRLAGRYGYPADHPFAVTPHPDRLEEPLRWKTPRMIFVCSMSDLFHQDVPDDYILAVFGVMAGCPQHTFQVLTKRPQRMIDLFASLERRAAKASEVFPEDSQDWRRRHGLRALALRHDVRSDGLPSIPSPPVWPLPNVRIGVSAEDQKRADERIPLLLQVPSVVRFVSVEPMLGSVDLRAYLPRPLYICQKCGEEADAGDTDTFGRHGYCGGTLDPNGSTDGLDWVICGGESGPGARPMHPEWVRSLRDQCQKAGVPYFFKQWGEWLPNAQEYGSYQPGANYDRKHVLFDGLAVARVGKLAAGALLDGREWREMPGTTSEAAVT